MLHIYASVAFILHHSWDKMCPLFKYTRLLFPKYWFSLCLDYTIDFLFRIYNTHSVFTRSIYTSINMYNYIHPPPPITCKFHWLIRLILAHRHIQNPILVKVLYDCWGNRDWKFFWIFKFHQTREIYKIWPKRIWAKGNAKFLMCFFPCHVLESSIMRR